MVLLTDVKTKKGHVVKKIKNPGQYIRKNNILKPLIYQANFESAKSFPEKSKKLKNQRQKLTKTNCLAGSTFNASGGSYFNND